MEERIRDRYSPQILDQALEAFGIDPGQLQELDGFESFIYEFNRDGEEGILRISHSFRRTPGQIRGELDWINYLNAGGAGVARALPGQDGQLLVEIPDKAGGYFLANRFEKARGEIYRGQWSEPFLFEYGRQLGLMHRLTTDYQPSDPAWKRPEWDDPIHLDVIGFLPREDRLIKQIYRDLVEETRSLPKDHLTYGLIHQDPHRGNFFVNENGWITFFDFDDSSYSWFVEDLALVLFYAVMGQEDQKGFTGRFLQGLMKGYYSEFNLDPVWMEKIPLFLKRREIDLYAVIHRSFDLDSLDDPWCSWYMDGRRERLLAREPYLKFNFSSLELDHLLG